MKTTLRNVLESKPDFRSITCELKENYDMLQQFFFRRVFLATIKGRSICLIFQCVFRWAPYYSFSVYPIFRPLPNVNFIQELNISICLCNHFIYGTKSFYPTETENSHWRPKLENIVDDEAIRITTPSHLTFFVERLAC